MPHEVPIRLIRSKRRIKTVTARLTSDGAALEILAPAAMSDAELAPIVERLRDRLLRRKQKTETADDRALAERARELNKRFFASALRPSEVRYVSNQQRRFGSCTPATASIRISHRVAGMPNWVLDYVLVHELAHLREANHGPRFWELVERYPLAERARGYLMALGLDADQDSGDDLPE